VSRFPWRALMAVGIGALGQSSEAFWNMTLRELVAAEDALGAARPMPPDRAALDELMRRFPDNGKDADRNR
jgi:uncharacterized phage protein (TIGR02216 family)